MALDPESGTPYDPSGSVPYGFFELHRGLEIFDGTAA